MTDRKDLAGSGHPKARAREAQKCASKHDQHRGNGKGCKRQPTPNPTNHQQPSPEPEFSIKTGTSSSGRDDRPSCYIKKKGSCLKDKNCDCWHFPLCVFHKRGQCSVGVNKSKGRAIVKQIKARGHFLQESKLETAILQRKRDTLSAWGQNESNIKFPGPFET